MPLLTPELINTLISEGKRANKPCMYQGYNLPIYLPVTDELTNYLMNEFHMMVDTKSSRGPSIYALLRQFPLFRYRCQQVFLVLAQHQLTTTSNS